MEDALARIKIVADLLAKCKGLNPCCNGRCTRTKCKELGQKAPSNSLNPCCNGRCTRTYIQRCIAWLY